MKLKDLEKAGVFTPTDGVKKNITWKNREGQEFNFDVFVQRSSYGMVERILLAEDVKSRSALTISECVLFGAAGEKMTYEQAYQLEKSFAKKLMAAIREVNKDDEEASAKN
jgi:hypothetical protein